MTVTIYYRLYYYIIELKLVNTEYKEYMLTVIYLLIICKVGQVLNFKKNS